MAEPGNGPARGGVRLTIRGENFGTETASRSVTAGGREGGNLLYEGHEQLSFDLPPGAPGTTVPVQLVVTGFVSNPVPFSFDPPAIASISPAAGPTQGSIPLTIRGQNSGLQSGGVRIGSMPSPVLACGDDEIVCLLLEDAGTVPVEVEPPGGVPAVFAYTYGPPVISSITPDSAPAAGGVLITIRGANFGPELLQPQVRFGSNVGKLFEWRGHDELLVLAPAGPPGGAVPLLVDVAGQVSNPLPFSYRGLPAIQSVTPLSGPTLGGWALTVIGQNFGPPGEVLFSGTPAPVLEWGNELIRCLAPPGNPGPVELQVVSEGSASEPFAANYDLPILALLEPAAGPAQGGSTITIYGSNFGRGDAACQVLVGPQPSPAVESLGHEALRAVVPPGAPGTQVPGRGGR